MGFTFDFSYVKSSLKRLHGILANTSIHGGISNAAAGNIQNWLDRHRHLVAVEPFKSLSQILSEYTQNQVVDQDELSELVAWCRDYTNLSPGVFVPFQKATQRLQRIIQDTYTDGSVTDFEILDLQGWLQEFGGIKTCWPLIEARIIVEKILTQRSVLQQDMEQLLDFYEGFNWQTDTANEQARLGEDPLFLQPIERLFTWDGNITFPGRRFCFTGNNSAPRQRLINMTRELLGIVEHEVSPGLDYLVVGKIGNAFWPNSIYGKRIKKAILNIRNDHPTAIIPEREFLAQAIQIARKDSPLQRHSTQTTLQHKLS